MADDNNWTPGDITSMIANPLYAITTNEGLTLPREPMISEDDWIRASVNLINELGPEPYLRNLLSILQRQLTLQIARPMPLQTTMWRSSTRSS